jgi:hypothetical protein
MRLEGLGQLKNPKAINLNTIYKQKSVWGVSKIFLAFQLFETSLRMSSSITPIQLK